MRQAADVLASARRIVVKIGSSLLISDDTPRTAWLSALAGDIAEARARGCEVIVVSSGAVALGRARLRMKRSPRLDMKQAAAAAGQALLMRAWDEALAPHDIAAAQLLLTFDDTEQRRRWLNARATMNALLGAGAVPVVNENDSVATEELRYGDNDRLSARVAQMAQADVLVLLSDVDGLYTADPGTDPDATHIAYLPQVSGEAEAAAAGASASGLGTGGMRTKLLAARIASAAGCVTLIGNGRADRPLARLSESGVATVIDAAGTPARAYKQWIAGALAPAGSLHVDAGAADALRKGNSLLAAGVRRVEGRFDKGACVRVLDPAGVEPARGICSYSSAETDLILGEGSDRFAVLLGYAGPEALIHRDDLAMMTP